MSSMLGCLITSQEGLNDLEAALDLGHIWFPNENPTTLPLCTHARMNCNHQSVCLDTRGDELVWSAGSHGKIIEINPI